MEQKAAELACYNCTVLREKTAFSASAQSDALLALKEQGIDGLVLTPFNDPAIARQIDRFSEEGIPVITPIPISATPAAWLSWAAISTAAARPPPA